MSTCNLEPRPERRGPGRPRLRPVDEERRLLLDAARRVFAARGFEGATMEAVAREAGVPRPTLYERFGGKDGLIIATVEDAAELMFQWLEGGFTAPPDVPWEDLIRRSYTAVFDLVAEHADVLTVLLLAERSGIPAESGLEGARQRVLTSLAERSSAQWAQFGARVGRASEIVALMFYGMSEAVALRQLEEDWDRNLLIDLLTDFTVGGLAHLWDRRLSSLRALDRPESHPAGPEVDR